MATVPEIDQSVLDYRSKTVNDYLADINKQLVDMDKVMNEELYQSNKPDSIVNRVFVDLFGVFGLYIMLFILSDFTRVVLTGGSFYGLKWLFWGPYYYFTGAPLLTRLWESKKFLKDLAEVEKDADFVWPENQSCTQIGNTYEKNCEDGTVKNHPIKDKMGDGLDWLIRHTIGKHFGGILGNGDCQDQGTTIAHDCAVDKVQALYDAYNAFCDMYPTLIYHRGSDINWPNGVSNRDGENFWNGYEKAAYNAYYDGYLAIFDTGSPIHTSTDFPTNLNPSYDNVSFYCYNANKVLGIGNYHGGLQYQYPLTWQIPSWYPDFSWYSTDSTDYKSNQMFFQLNYKDHIYD